MGVAFIYRLPVLPDSEMAIQSMSLMQLQIGSFITAESEQLSQDMYMDATDIPQTLFNN